jgi:hypothetical protein
VDAPSAQALADDPVMQKEARAVYQMVQDPEKPKTFDPTALGPIITMIWNLIQSCRTKTPAALKASAEVAQRRPHSLKGIRARVAVGRVVSQELAAAPAGSWLAKHERHHDVTQALIDRGAKASVDEIAETKKAALAISV